MYSRSELFVSKSMSLSRHLVNLSWMLWTHECQSEACQNKNGGVNRSHFISVVSSKPVCDKVKNKKLKLLFNVEVQIEHYQFPLYFHATF